ncbi:Cilia- and flagella-associated protein 20 [Mucor velutinosus]|uniref:Cilia- and flagella-associated protein 20 n=1 Tax=Mucor velutinosus TaxID=708070 RepID=A0AAN7DAB1_9FUNG|nr:Cilia- and flagella-associated protein 20 [Mucor velutinosus]
MNNNNNNAASIDFTARLLQEMMAMRSEISQQGVQLNVFVVPEGLQLSIKIKVFLMGRYVCVVQQHGQAMISEVHLSYLNTEVHQM